MVRTAQGLVVSFLGMLLLACGPEISPEISAQIERLPEKIDYNFHIKPILSDRCFACHGPDAQNRKAELRLDTETGARAALVSGNGHAVVPGSLGKSALAERILSDDPELQMPPPESNLRLSAHEKALLLKWLDEGAEYRPHWAFTKPVKPKIPTAMPEWGNNEIDRFIAQKLAENRMSPSAEAKRETLVRRLYFDLLGLPPNLKELDRVLKDPRPDYYERLVDSLLDLPEFGERMAAHWLDVARFADSEGYLDDFHHEMWPYRDWVINSFNKNLPYNQFILWQVGGDQIPEGTDEQRLATAFNRTHKQNSEGGIIPEEFRVEYVADRTNTLGTAFMGLTVACARCHDHKYDPFSQKNYYELFAFFNSTVERGDAIFAFNAVENGNEVPNALSMNAGPVLALADQEIKQLRKFLSRQQEEKEEKLSELTLTHRDKAKAWMEKASPKHLENTARKATMVYLDFDGASEGKCPDLADGSKPARYFGLDVQPGRDGLAVRCGDQGQLIADGSRISFERSDPFTVSFWIKTPKTFENAHILYNGNNRIQGYRGWDVILDSTRLSFRLSHAHPYQSLDIRLPQALPVEEWQHFVWTYDGSGKASGMKVYKNGEETPHEVLRDYLYRSTKPYTDTRATVYMPYQGMIIGNRHYDEDFEGGMLDDVRVLNTEAGALMASYLHHPQNGEEVFSGALARKSEAALEYYHLHVDEKAAATRAQLRSLRMQQTQAIDTVQEIMVMGDWEKERPTYILDRGVYDAQGDKVKRDVPEEILAWPENLPKNRYGLGLWLIHEDHPLTARVAVNQFWYLMFGKGLVATLEDFGSQGALPSHPELLDWLATDFVENGWDVKRLLRQLVTSATYKQSSVVTKNLLETDPDNQLYARSSRYRRSAEMVRDNALAVSGLLDKTLGGPSVFPYQPEGLWKETTSHPFFPGYQVDYEKGLYRRSIYTFWKRNMPPPSMLVFDAATRGECQVRRQRSNTPLQALVLLNDPQILEACCRLSENVLKTHPESVAEASRIIFRTLTGRLPGPAEEKLLIRQYEEEKAYFKSTPGSAREFLSTGRKTVNDRLPPDAVAALARVANTIMNSTEGYYKN